MCFLFVRPNQWSHPVSESLYLSLGFYFTPSWRHSPWSLLASCSYFGFHPSLQCDQLPGIWFTRFPKLSYHFSPSMVHMGFTFVLVVLWIKAPGIDCLGATLLKRILPFILLCWLQLNLICGNGNSHESFWGHFLFADRPAVIWPWCHLLSKLFLM